MTYEEEMQEIEEVEVFQPKKKKKKKKRRKKRIFLKFLLFLSFCIAIGYFLSSSFFDVQKLNVVNNSYYTSEQILKIVEDNVKIGINIFSLDAKDIKSQLLNDAYIKNVKIKRKLPSTVIIDVLERKECVSIPFGQEFILIDDEEMVLRLSNVNPELTLILGMNLKTVEPGKLLEVEESKIFKGTLELVKEVGEKEIYFKKIDVSNVVIKAYIYDSLICEGEPENIKNNLSSLELVLQELYEQNIERGVLKVGSENEIHFSPIVE